MMEQETKLGYCKVENKEKVFVQDCDYKNVWVCTGCFFRTSELKQLPKIEEWI